MKKNTINNNYAKARIILPRYIKECLILLLFSISFVQSSFSQYWMKTNVPPPFSTNHWLDVYFLPSDPNYGWVCGFAGLVIRSTDGGLSWQGTGIDSAFHLESIHFVNRNVGYCSGVEGIYKSTDGGRTWRDITPDTTLSYWGCYFATENIGVVLSGGCLNNIQRFFRTTDGGTTWSLFEGYEVNTGLTDALLYSADGLGYASSSGKIWKTLNGGVSWSVHAQTGTNVWAEEISHNGNSFLIPHAGATCIGDKSAGGARFSTDDGATWHVTEFGRAMYGTFLIDGVTGWAVGDNNAIYYTTNAGRNWELRNCGITQGNLDDIYFLNANTGWVVGNNGVYKLVPDKHTVSNTIFNFPEICIPNSEVQSFWVANFSFNETKVRLSKFADDDNSFSVQSPDTVFTLGPCDSVRVYLKFEPKTEGIKTARYSVSFDGKNEYTLNLEGIGMISRAQVNDTLLIIDPAYCGRENRDSLLWSTLSPFNEYVSEIRPVGGTYLNRITRMPPIHLTQKEQAMIFSINPPDTGWYKTRFIVTTMPCRVDTFVTVASYGVSPIITANKKHDFMLECKKSMIDTIPVFNTGNDTLLISNMQVLQNQDVFSIVGWSSGYKNMTRILPGKSDSLLVSYTPKNLFEYTTIIRLLNDDKTTARGNMSPYDIAVKANYSNTEIYTKDTIVDYGDVCIGTIKEMSIVIGNKGDKDAFIEYPDFVGENYSTSRLKEDFPVALPSDKTADIKLRFHPQRSGIFLDTLYFNTLPCNEKAMFIAKGIGIETKLSTNPDFIKDTVSVNEVLSVDVTVKSIGNSRANISRIELEPANADWDFKFTPNLPVSLEVGEATTFTFEFFSEIESYLNSKICFYTDETCESKTCFPIEIMNRSRMFLVNPEFIDYNYQKCERQRIVKEIDITNIGIDGDSIVEISIIPPNAGFTIVDAPPLPKGYNKYEKTTVKVEYYPLLEGIHNAELVLKSFYPGGQTFVIPLSGEFRTVVTKPDTTVIDYFDYEPCADDVETIIIFENEGTLTDSLIISRRTNLTGLLSEPVNLLVVPEKYRAQFLLTFSPSEFKQPGIYSDTFLLESVVCGNVHLVIVNIRIVRPVLNINPKVIDFGSIWRGDPAYDTVFVNNQTDFDKKIISLNISPNDPQIEFDAILPMAIQAGSQAKIPLKFTAMYEGNYIYALEIIEESVCKDTTGVEIVALVPEEVYNTRVKIDKYTALPGVDITIALELLDTIKRVKPQSIYYEINFDSKLFLPKMVALSPMLGGKILSFDYSFGTLRGEIPSPEAQIAFQEPGDLLHITGMTLFSMPDTTGLFIRTFRPETDKVVYVDKEDGFLDLYGFCVPIGFTTIPNFNVNIQNPVLSGNELLLDIFSSEKQTLHLTLTNILGVEVNKMQLNLLKDRASYTTDISKLSSGTYFIIFKSEYDLYQRRNIVIVR